ncbi:TIGR03761 family integrating conjugative element protein [Buttiauxella selenatireducens]|uniref:TIGR03761 family integrating conjugative element protein n=1 Tax=Buttiauxella selenatireducens TaxID=3073902 RepID=A0ABY9S7V6_9ENTR|nr:TIGR03761 family integrating conjugative element protein [Buttiauxella sp. R73]WMY72516.1 TIGR03761 family integrating conjugative element protein [Buttiauxella sp. R73]
MSNTDPQFNLTSGPLRSTVTIELHTHYATQAWAGRLPNREENIYGIIGLPRFITIMNIIRLDALADNPYADLWMLLLEERLLVARDGMNALIGSMEVVFSQVPEMMTVEGSASIKPARFPVFASTQLGFIAVYLLTDYDTLMRKALLAQHMALLTRAQMNDLRQTAGKLIRSILVQAQKYQRIAVCRQDIREGNARAIAATEQVGPVPEDIFDGRRRSNYAPPLRQSDVHIDGAAVSVAETELEDEVEEPGDDDDAA